MRGLEPAGACRIQRGAGGLPTSSGMDRPGEEPGEPWRKGLGHRPPGPSAPPGRMAAAQHPAAARRPKP